MKKCSKCKKEKEDKDFCKDSKTLSGLYSSCKECVSFRYGDREKIKKEKEERVKRNKEIKELRFQKKKTLKFIGDKYKITHERVRQILGKNTGWILSIKYKYSFNCLICNKEKEVILTKSLKKPKYCSVKCRHQSRWLRKDKPIKEYTKEEIKIHNKKRNDKTKELRKEYYEKNKEKVKAYNKSSKRKVKNKIACLKYYQKNKEKINKKLRNERRKIIENS